MSNIPTETVDVPLEITDKDTAHCRNLKSFCEHPKFLQFLALFNADRKRKSQEQTDLIDVTVEDLMKSPRIAEDAFEFFQKLRLTTTDLTRTHIHQMITASRTKIEKRRELFGELQKTENDTFPCLLQPRAE